MKRFFLLLLVLIACSPKQTTMKGQTECEARVKQDLGTDKVDFVHKDDKDDKIYWDRIIVMDKVGNLIAGSFNCWFQDGRIVKMDYYGLD